MPCDFLVYWLCPSGLLLRDTRPVADDWLLAVPRLVELACEVVVRDDLVADLFCPVCVRPAVLLVDSFMTDKEFSLTLCCRSCRKNLSAESKFVTPHC